MAFTGTAAIHQITDRMVRVTGLSLGASATGTIGLNGNTGTPGVRLPAAFQPAPYTYAGATVSLQDSVRCEVVPAVGATQTFPIGVVKSGTTDADFLMTLANTGASVSGNLEFYITFHD